MAWLKKHDVLTKAIAFLVALVLWFVIVNVEDIDATHTFKGIKPVFVGQDEIKASRNLLIVEKGSVNIEVAGKRGDLLLLDQSSIKVEVDVSKITEVGTHELKYTVTLPSDSYTIKSKKPDTISVRVDKEDFNVIPVNLSTEGIAADGYIVDEEGIELLPSELNVSGLQEEIDKIAYAQVSVLGKNQKTTFSDKMEYSFYDANGKLLNLPSVKTEYNTIDVTVPILKIKNLPLEIDVLEGDSFAESVSYTFEPEAIQIAGEESVVEQMTKLVVGTVSVSDFSSQTEKSFEINLPEGLINLSDIHKATAKIEFDGLTSKTVNATLIQLVNVDTLPDGYKIKPITKSLSVTLVGKGEVLKNVNSSNVRIVVDFKSTVLSRGTHTVKASIVVDNNKDVAVVNSDSYAIQVNVQ